MGYVSNVLDAISTEHRPVIEQELENRNPALFDELRRTEKQPTNRATLLSSLLRRLDEDLWT